MAEDAKPEDDSKTERKTEQGQDQPAPKPNKDSLQDTTGAMWPWTR